MEFFNQKEEVLDIVLTAKGKQLLSQGKFKPYGYKFFDNETVYETLNNEQQNQIEERIKTTPYGKPEIPKSFFDTDKPASYISNIYSPFGFFSKGNLPNELGQSDQFTQYAPSWNIEFLESPSTYKKSFLSASFNNKTKVDEIVPQFDVSVNYRLALVYTYYEEKEDKYYYTEEKGKFNHIQLVLQKDTNDVFVKAVESNSFLETQKQELSMELFEYFRDSPSSLPSGKLRRINLNPDEEESYIKYFTILFDDVAEEESRINTKNIYEESTEDVC